MELKADYQKGLSYSDIGRKYNIDRRTTKKTCTKRQQARICADRFKTVKIESVQKSNHDLA